MSVRSKPLQHLEATPLAERLLGQGTKIRELAPGPARDAWNYRVYAPFKSWGPVHDDGAFICVAHRDRDTAIRMLIGALSGLALS